MSTNTLRRDRALSDGEGTEEVSRRVARARLYKYSYKHYTKVAATDVETTAVGFPLGTIATIAVSLPLLPVVAIPLLMDAKLPVQPATLYREMRETDLHGNEMLFTDEPVLSRELRPGQHIFVPVPATPAIGSTFPRTPQGTLLTVGYALAQRLGMNLYHHGIFLGKVKGPTQPEQVAEFGRDTERHPVIKPLKEFMDGSWYTPLFRRRYLKGYTHQFTTLSRIAKEMDGNKGWGRFSWTENNCEHYATYLKTGRPWSEQAARFSRVELTSN